VPKRVERRPRLALPNVSVGAYERCSTVEAPGLGAMNGPRRRAGERWWSLPADDGRDLEVATSPLRRRTRADAEQASDPQCLWRVRRAVPCRRSYARANRPSCRAAQISAASHTTTAAIESAAETQITVVMSDGIPRREARRNGGLSASAAVPTEHLASERVAGLWLPLAYEEPPGSGHDRHQRPAHLHAYYSGYGRSRSGSG